MRFPTKAFQTIVAAAHVVKVGIISASMTIEMSKIMIVDQLVITNNREKHSWV